jgi:WD40 repeat protein
MPDVFVSYSRRDSEFVRRLAESVAERGKEVWVDTEGIADGEVFPEAIKRAIEQSDAFLFVITPASVQSSYCENEVDYAREMQKRIVPVLRDPVPDGELPPEIRDRNWIPFTDDAQFDPSLERLVKALDADLDGARAHTRWLVKALEWDSEGRDKSFLLRGSELKSAEGWLAASPEDADPAPTAVQREYLLASREAAARRQRGLVGASGTVALLSIGLLIFALISRGQAISAGARAVSERIGARSQALAAESQAQLANDPEISLILAMSAVRERATPQSLFALRAALDASPLQRALPNVSAPGSCGGNGGLAVAYSPDGRQIAEAACNGSLRLFDAGSLRLLRAENPGGPLSSVAYSPSGSLLAVGTATGVVVVNPATGSVQARLTAVPAATAPGVSQIAFSRDGRTLAADDPAGVTVWTLPGLHPRALASDPTEGGSMVFSRDGRLLIVGGGDASVHIYDVASGRMVHRIVAPGHQPGSWPEVVALSPDGSQLAVGYPSGSSGQIDQVSIYRTAGWKKQFDVMTVDLVEIASVAFSPDGSRLAIGEEDGTAGVWSLPTRQRVASYDGPTAAVGTMVFTPGGQSVLTASNDGVSRIWRALGSEQTFVPIQGGIAQMALTPTLLTVVNPLGRNGGRLDFVRLPDGRLLRTWNLGRRGSPTLSPDGRFLASVVAPRGPPPSASAPAGPPRSPLLIYDVAGRKLLRTLPPARYGYVAFGPDDTKLLVMLGGSGNSLGTPALEDAVSGRMVSLQAAGAVPCGVNPQDFAISANDRVLVGGSFCGFADVWNARTGRLIRRFNQGAEMSSAGLSPDGKRLLISSWDSRATIYDVASGRPLANLVGHTRGIGFAAFNPDASMVVTASLDHTVRVWDARTGQQLRVLTFADGEGLVVFSADGRLMAMAGGLPVSGVASVARVYETCPACTNPKALLGQAAPHAVPSNRLTLLERTVINHA